jgi:hypothetical protein
MLDINELNQAIFTALNVSNVTDEITGIYHGKAPQNTAYPFVTYFCVDNTDDQTFQEWREDALIQVDIWSDEPWPKETGDISEKVADELDNADLTGTNYGFYFCKRISTRLLYEDDNKIWHMVMEYDVRFEKSK